MTYCIFTTGYIHRRCSPPAWPSVSTSRVHSQHPNRIPLIHNTPVPLQTLLNGNGNKETAKAKLKQNAKSQKQHRRLRSPSTTWSGEVLSYLTVVYRNHDAVLLSFHRSRHTYPLSFTQASQRTPTAPSFRVVTGRSGGGHGEVARIGDTGYNPLFRLRLRTPCAGECFHKQWQRYRGKVQPRVSRFIQYNPRYGGPSGRMGNTALNGNGGE
ncbi:hypothetical protein B9Z19DRAFT_1189108 [Tuber borchii]|uniref:Uncharacterized protein n=1 Tax=Tuber borchii TaxID=42251 RepID=A0A2T7A8Z6_TUBBO|nr:hypothetical protein B9Z19DRAFT_1189108 [Tuber borchii]